MAYFKIGSVDFSKYVSSLKPSLEVLLSEDSGRNAAGNNVVDIVNRKDKIEVGFIPMNDTQMAKFLSAIQPYVVTASYRDPRTNVLKSIRCYTGTPSLDYYTIQEGRVLYKPFTLSFIEM